MRIVDGKLVLRDFCNQDIEDEVRWNTVLTDWMEADTPWMDDEPDDEGRIRSDMGVFAMMSSRMPDTTVRPRLEIEWEGKHVGFISSYFLENDYTEAPYDPFRRPDGMKQAVGLAICEPEWRGKGIGTEALALFESYLRERGRDEICIETWPGNTPMLHIAEKRGYVLVRKTERAHAKGNETWDGLVLMKKL